MAKRKRSPLVRKYKTGKLAFNVHAYDVMTFQKLIEEFVHRYRKFAPSEINKSEITLYACVAVLVDFLYLTKWSFVYGSYKTFSVKPYQASALIIALEKSEEPFFIDLKAALLKAL